MSRTVLLVDDSKTERVVLTGFLRSEYDLIEAESGEEAIEILRKKYKAISAIILDVVMPGMDGFETLKIIKANALWLQIPVVITTGLDDDASREKAIICGADNFVTKPFNQRLLLHIVQNVIKLRETAALANTLYRDSMTGLLNRESFYIEAARMIKRQKAGFFALSILDVENFKVVNDQYGTEVGDKVLKHIARELSVFASNNGGLACRYMGDKFAVLFPALLLETGVFDECHSLMTTPSCLTRPIRIRVGRYLIAQRGLPVSAMCDRASLAEGSVKGRFDAYYADYTDKMRDELLHEQEIVNEMVAALHNGEFEPWFQPQYNHATGALIGAEALVRWRKNGKVVPPGSFIPVFERNGFIYEVDQSIWRQVCRRLRKWLSEGKTPMPVSVNISRYDLYQKDFLDVICGLVREYDLPIDLLRLEITESAFSDSPSIIIDITERLIAYGFTVEIDDFGSGYSSLNTLKDIPASIIKLDMRFFEATKNSARGGNIVESVVRMAKWLGMAIIAEGVEDRAQADYLKSIGCYYIQGYFYSRPVSVEDYDKLLEHNKLEPKLARLETLETLDNNEFWNPQSMETLIFNSYVGGACIFEFAGGKTELLRINDQYINELHGIIPKGTELKDASLFRFFDDGSKRALLEMLKAASQHQREASCELRLTNGPQTEYVRLTARVIARADTRLLYYGVIVNLTEQRLSEKAALDVSEQIAAIMNNTQSGITAFVITEAGRVERLFVNQRFYELMGYTAEQFNNEVSVPFDCIYPEDRERAVSETLRLQKVGESVTMQMRAVRRDGSVIWLRADVAMVNFANIPHPVQLSNFVDITEQVEAERKRQESAEQLSIIMSNINGSVSAFLLDDAGNTRLIFGNDKYYDIFGYTKEQAETVHLDPMSCVIPEDFDSVVEKLNRLKSDGLPIDIDYRAQRRDGRLIYVRAVCSRMSMEGYGEGVIVSVETDITEQRTLRDQLSAVVENINGGVSAVCLNNGALEYILVNDKYFDIIGYTREEFAAEVTDVFDIVHPDDRKRVEMLVREAAETEKAFTMEYRIIRRNGAVRYILCTTNVMRLFGVEQTVQLAVTNDVTVLRQAQQKERDLSVQMQTIMENIHGGVTATLFHSKDDVEIVFSNDGFYELYGYTKEQLEAELPNMLDLIIPEDRGRTMETVERIVAERGSATYEYRCRKRDGSIMWTQVANAVISMEGVGDTVLLAIATDITALRLAEQRSRETTDRLHAVMDAMNSGVTAVAFHGDHTEFLFANERYYRMHGITKEGYEQNELRDSLALVYPDDRELLRELVMNATEVGQTAEAEYRLQRPDGTVRWAKANVHVTRLADVDVPVQVTIFTDINAEKVAIEQLRFLNESAHAILSQPDAELAINDTLAKINGYFRAERSYVVELDYARGVSSNTYEVCAPGVRSEKENLQELAFTPSDPWFETLSSEGCMVIKDVGALGESQAGLRALLSAQGIRSIIIVALKRDGQLIGFTGADDPTNALEQVAQLTALADYISSLLTRRDLKRKISRDSETLRQLMDDTPGGFCRMRIYPDAAPALVTMNKGFCRMLDMTAEEVTAACGDDMFKCLMLEDMASSPLDLADAGQFSTKCRLRKKDGAFLWVMMFGRFVREENGELFLNSFFTDITAEKDAEQHQIELLDNLPMGAALYEYDGRDLKVIHINRRYWTLVGREPAEYEKASVLDAVDPNDRDMVRQEIESAIRQGRNAAIDCRLLYGEDAYKPFHISANITPKGDGRYALCTAYMPISDEAMSIQEMLPIALSTMVACAEDISYVKDKDLRYICVSQSVAEMAGVKNPRDFIGKSADEMFSATFSEKFNEDDRRVIETGETVMHTLEHIPMADGGVCLARTSKFPILDASGSAVGVYCISHDISAQKKKESQLELLTSSIPGGLAAYSISGDGFTTLYFNEGYYAYSGYTREEYAAMTQAEPLALLLPEDRPKLLAMVRGFAANKKDGLTGSCAYRVRTKFGAVRFMSMKAVLSQVGEDAFILNAVQLDLTDQLESERQRTLLLDTIPGGIACFRCMPNNIETLYLNDGVCVLAGYSREEYARLQTPVLEFVFAEDRPIIHRQLELLQSGETELDFTFRIHAKGAMKWINSKAHTTGRTGDVYEVSAVLTDVTDQQEEKERRLLAEEEYRLAIAHAGCTICRYNIAEQTLTVAQDVAARLELPEYLTDVPYGRVKLGEISPETEDSYIAFFESIIRGERECSATFRKHLNTGWRWIFVRSSTIFNNAGKPVSAIISYTDVTEQREKEAAYSRWQNSLSERSPDSYTLFRCNLSKSSSYESWEGELLGLRFEEGKQTFDERTDEFVRQCVYAEDRERYRAFMLADTMLAEYYRGHRTDSIEFRQLMENGRMRWLRLSVDLMEYPDSSDVEAILMYENIDDKKRSELKTIERAETDPLTGVLNRATFAVRANQIISQSKAGTHHALLMLDIDSFKQVNDIFGHGAGDRVLTDIADLLTRSSRKEDLVGRLGGDEFLLFLTDIPSEAAVAAKARQLCELTRREFSVNVHISSSIGVAVYPQDGEGFEALYKTADTVLYRVKDSGKNGYAFVHDELAPDTGFTRQTPQRKGELPKTGSRRRILIVDDNKLDMAMLSEIFAREYRIERATDGAMALSKLRHYGTAVSVVLLDLMMPGMDGYEVLQKMQQEESIRAIPVIVVSADEQRETVLRVIRAGASDLVAKPVDPDVLRVRVECAISRSENERRRVQSSYLSMRSAEVSNYRSALERSGILVITLDWGKNEFSYSPSVSARLAGEYDGRRFWRVLLSDMMAGTRTVEQMQQLVHEVAEDRDRMDGSMTVRLKTAEGAWRLFEMNVFKEINDVGNAGKLLLTLRETPQQTAGGERK